MLGLLPGSPTPFSYIHPRILWAVGSSASAAVKKCCNALGLSFWMCPSPYKYTHPSDGKKTKIRKGKKRKGKEACL